MEGLLYSSLRLVRSRAFKMLAVILVILTVIPAIRLEASASGGTFPTYVEVDGKRTMITFNGGTVAQLLERLAVELSVLDEVIPPLDEQVKADDVIIVTRKEIVTETVRTRIPFDTVYTYSPNVMPGKEVILSEGKDGIREEVIQRLIIDGELAGESVRSSEVTQEPVNNEVLIGFAAKPVSSFDFGCEFDEKGEPTEYIEVMRGRRSAGYTARPGAVTASGRSAGVGHVAVNPREIPYGTKLFVKSSCGRYIYGYAVAADTGTDLRNGRIAIDLFYETRAECMVNGIRDVDIFILKWPE